VHAPTLLEVEDVQNKNDAISLFGVCVTVESVCRIYERGPTRGSVQQEITVFIREAVMDRLKRPSGSV
jgi:hypothetical protein